MYQVSDEQFIESYRNTESNMLAVTEVAILPKYIPSIDLLWKQATTVARLEMVEEILTKYKEHYNNLLQTAYKKNNE